MTDEKSKKPLKLKTMDDLRKDTIYELNLFSKKRRSQLCSSAKLIDEDMAEDQVFTNFFIFFSFVEISVLIRSVSIQVITDSDNGEDSDEETSVAINDKTVTTSGQKKQKQRKVRRKESVRHL